MKMLTENVCRRRYQIVRDFVVVNLSDQKLTIHRDLGIFSVNIELISSILRKDFF